VWGGHARVRGNVAFEDTHTARGFTRVDMEANSESANLNGIGHGLDDATRWDETP
jgi:hypothetical protein